MYLFYTVIQEIIARIKRLYVQYRHNFFPNIFSLWVVESIGVELMDMEASCIYVDLYLHAHTSVSACVHIYAHVYQVWPKYMVNV